MSLLIPLLCLLALAAYASAAETVWRSLARSPLPAPPAGSLGRLAADLERDPRRLLTAAFLLKHAANVAAVAMATLAARELAPRYALSLSILGMTVVLLLGVELLPGRLSASHRLAAARLTLPLHGFARLLGRLVAPLSGLPAACAPAAGDGVTEAELLTMVAAVHGGDIKEREKQLIHNIFEFDDTRVSEIMTPRADMFVVDADRPLDLETVFRSGFSRIPVIERDIDRIVGILNIKDLLLHPAGQRPPEVRAIMREPYVVPEGKKLDALLQGSRSWTRCCRASSGAGSTWPWWSTSTGACPGWSRSKMRSSSWSARSATRRTSTSRRSLRRGRGNGGCRVRPGSRR
ncbi:MAG: CNNM domain-containing protein [Desulfobacterales bacterium]|nr:CNNM domain-containing protein [Desulfobacterales bacterium]